jgi:hypothetical protein
MTATLLKTGRSAVMLTMSLMAAHSMAGCKGGGAAATGKEACDGLKGEVSALDETYGGGVVEGKVRAFVQATKDMDWASTQVEHLAADACRRIGQDLGMADNQMQPQKGPGGIAAGSCGPVALQLDAVLRQGVRLWVTVVPAQCQPNMGAWQRCGGVCDVNADPECRASCQAHANVHASCRQGQVSVRASTGGEQAAALIATLNANMAALIEAEQTTGQRLLNDAGAIAQVGGSLGRSSKDADSKARACIGASKDVAGEAALRMRVSVRSAALITSRVRGM